MKVAENREEGEGRSSYAGIYGFRKECIAGLVQKNMVNSTRRAKIESVNDLSPRTPLKRNPEEEPDLDDKFLTRQKNNMASKVRELLFPNCQDEVTKNNCLGEKILEIGKTVDTLLENHKLPLKRKLFQLKTSLEESPMRDPKPKNHHKNTINHIEQENPQRNLNPKVTKSLLDPKPFIPITSRSHIPQAIITKQSSLSKLKSSLNDVDIHCPRLALRASLENSKTQRKTRQKSIKPSSNTANKSKKPKSTSKIAIQNISRPSSSLRQIRHQKRSISTIGDKMTKSRHMPGTRHRVFDEYDCAVGPRQLASPAKRYLVKSVISTKNDDFDMVSNGSRNSLSSRKNSFKHCVFGGGSRGMSPQKEKMFNKVAEQAHLRYMKLQIDDRQSKDGADLQRMSLTARSSHPVLATSTMLAINAIER